MSLVARNIVELALALSVALAAGLALMIVLAVGRRRRRDRHFKRLDALRENFGPLVSAIVAGDVEYLRGLSTLDQLQGYDRTHMLEQLCLEQHPTPEQLPVLRRLCEDLGLVQVWQRNLMGQEQRELLRDSVRRPGGLVAHVSEFSFLLRAQSAENLRLIRHEASWPLLANALEDAHPDVRRVAARALGTLAVPESFPALVKRLHSLVLEPQVTISLRILKTALVGFPLERALDLAPSLNHAHPRIRFLATDTVREMVERRASLESDFVLRSHLFPRKLAEIFLLRLPFDTSADVRARAAPVIAYLPEQKPHGLGGSGLDVEPAEVLTRLLDDPQWFVRLHTVRALGKPRYAALTPRITRRLTDPNWRVREAAARALVAAGQPGIDGMIEHLVNTRDRYSQEQIIEELEQSNLIPSLLDRYVQGTGAREGRVLETFVNLGKTSSLERILQNGVNPEVRRKFWMDFRAHPDRRVHAWAKRVTGN
ncbi:MAG TPA: HEAT repeat domain-containing protein [Terriglobia bacterium]|nr:HEAT repeat domain-containing protein [Terriglobia bacterium]